MKSHNVSTSYTIFLTYRQDIRTSMLLQCFYLHSQTLLYIIFPGIKLALVPTTVTSTIFQKIDWSKSD